MDALDLHVEQRTAVDADAGFAQDAFGQPCFVGEFDEAQTLAEYGIIGLRAQGLQSVQIAAPAGADAGIEQGRQTGIRLLQPAARGDAVGDIVEAFREQPGVVREDGVDHQLRMQGRHAVDAVRCDHRQCGHAHMADAAFIDQRNAFGQLFIVREACAHIGQETVVDVVDDFQMARQQRLHQGHRPGFQRFRHQGVIGVGHRFAGDPPGVVPFHAVLVHQQAHQLRRCQCRMGVV